MRELVVGLLCILHLDISSLIEKRGNNSQKANLLTARFKYVFYQVGHFLLQLQHEYPVLAVLVQRVDDELGQVSARAVSVDFSWKGTKV